ncbi:uncharacterized protein LOC114915423 isoform X3 [Cajanus cajan]|uniref:uncharacterized protein LOC114915423 isoform X3 n=1 Tax=Cajanus cajan TaxID=3821 RepID=UPI0010FB6C51|nr:uncharacterized protein LOC114915423 isoform X3 [Cajanus cajan]
MRGWMARGLRLSYQQALRNQAPAGTSAEDHWSVAVDYVPVVAEARPPPMDVGLPDPNARKKKDKGKCKADVVTSDAPRLKHHRGKGLRRLGYTLGHRGKRFLVSRDLAFEDDVVRFIV